MTPAPFVAFQTDHLATLAGIGAAAGGMIALARSRRWPRLVRALEITLAALLILSWPAEWLSAIHVNHVTWEEILPLHLCDLASFTGAAALVWHHRFAAELTYFWAMAGTLNGLITPTVKYAFPHPSFLAFFLLHGTVVTTAVYLVAGRGFWPRPGAVRRTFFASLAYLAGITAINAALNTNFAFIRRKPENASLLDLLGEWPWYVVALIPLGLFFFSVLYAPFWLARRLATPMKEPEK